MYRIRNATLQDARAISEVHVQCWRECYPFLPDGLHQARSVQVRFDQWVARLRGDAAHYTLVLEDAGRVVGFGCAVPSRDEDLPDADWELHACYFLPEYRRMAAGPEMMRKLIEGAEEQGARSVCVWVWEDNPLRITYGQLGLRPEVRRNRELCGYEIPEIGYLCKDLKRLSAKLEVMSSALARRGGASQSLQFDQARLRPIDLRNGIGR